MNPDNLVIVAISVFALMFLGLILTVLEFTIGEPKDQEDEYMENEDSEK